MTGNQLGRFFCPYLLPACLIICLVNDTLDEIFEESGDEEESQDIVNQVLDEIGIEISGKVRNSKCEQDKTNFLSSMNLNWGWRNNLPIFSLTCHLTDVDSLSGAHSP